MRKMFPRQENPYFDSDKIATPYPNSLRSAYYGRVSECTARFERVGANLVAANLELGHVPGRVLVRRPLDVSKLRLVRRVIVLDVERELELEELVSLVPVDLRIKAEERARVLRGC